jgi:Phosphoesterase family
MGRKRRLLRPSVPPAAVQGGKRTPDGIYPGQCEDLSLPPLSELPGFGAECSYNFTSTTDTSVADAEQLCPALAQNPYGAYPTSCAAFDQLGVRVPFVAVSPFSKPNYVSHVVTDHTSILRLIEERFLSSQSMTKRDRSATVPLDMFDFTHSPSLNAKVTQAQPPQNDCTPGAVSGAFGRSLRPYMLSRQP